MFNYKMILHGFKELFSGKLFALPSEGLIAVCEQAEWRERFVAHCSFANIS